MEENGLVAVVKRDCPTCVMVAPVLQEIHRAKALKALEPLLKQAR